MIPLKRPLKVYLAGGFKSGWQDTVIQESPQAKYYDPRTHGLFTPKSYTKWDLAAVKKSDLVFAYLEANNPGGYALALELGYAKALGKIIVLVDETEHTQARHKYIKMLHAIADAKATQLSQGIKILQRLSRGGKRF